MEVLSCGYTLRLSPGAFPLSTDSMVLADFVRLPRKAQVLDLGSGCGTLGLLLCGRDPGCQVTGVELDPLAHSAALENIAANGLSPRLSSICADLRSVPPELPWGQFSCCISNPPYFSGGAASRKTPLARRDDCLSTAELTRLAAKALRFGGDFFVVQKPDRLARLCFEASRNGLEPKRLRLVRSRPQGPVSLILLQCRRGGRPGLLWEELTLTNPDGSPSDDYRRIYHL